MKLHKDANVEINDYGNDLFDVENFAKHLEIEINITDAEQFNSIVYTANTGSEDKIYLLKTRNHFDVIKSLTAFYDTPYYATSVRRHTPKEINTIVHQSVYHASSTQKIRNARVKKQFAKSTNRKFFGKRCFKNHLKNRSKVENKTDIVCDTVKKCLDCSRIITCKYLNCHKCGYSECNNCNKYVGKNHKCFMKKIKAKGGYCTVDSKEPRKNKDSIKNRLVLFV